MYGLPWELPWYRSRAMSHGTSRGSPHEKSRGVMVLGLGLGLVLPAGTHKQMFFRQASRCPTQQTYVEQYTSCRGGGIVSHSHDKIHIDRQHNILTNAAPTGLGPRLSNDGGDIDDHRQAGTRRELDQMPENPEEKLTYTTRFLTYRPLLDSPTTVPL